MSGLSETPQHCSILFCLSLLTPGTQSRTKQGARVISHHQEQPKGLLSEAGSPSDYLLDVSWEKKREETFKHTERGFKIELEFIVKI